MEQSDDDFMKNSWHDVDIVDCRYCRYLRQLSALLMPRLELQLIILMTWICFHFRKVNRYTCRNYPKTSQNSQNVFNSKYLNFHSSSNIVIENKNVNKSKSSWWWVATRDEASIRHIIGTLISTDFKIKTVV